MGEKRNAYWVLVGRLEYFDIRGRILLKWILEYNDAVVWTELIWFRIGTSGGLL
jgi:hypothetical protein